MRNNNETADVVDYDVTDCTIFFNKNAHEFSPYKYLSTSSALVTPTSFAAESASNNLSRSPLNLSYSFSEISIAFSIASARLFALIFIANFLLFLLFLLVHE
ncbi:MAG: hypothetical protein ACP6IU_08420 [Candidatus Asgardarchaeia archaeon]